MIEIDFKPINVDTALIFYEVTFLLNSDNLNFEHCTVADFAQLKQLRNSLHNVLLDLNKELNYE